MMCSSSSLPTNASNQQSDFNLLYYTLTILIVYRVNNEIIHSRFVFVFICSFLRLITLHTDDVVVVVVAAACSLRVMLSQARECVVLTLTYISHILFLRFGWR
jgi:hypothetical protein